MKKYISLLLAALMLLSLLAGCGGGKTNADDGDGTRTLVLRNTAGLSTNDPHATTAPTIIPSSRTSMKVCMI